MDNKALQSNQQEYGRNLSANASAAMLESAHTSKENIEQSKQALDQLLQEEQRKQTAPGDTRHEQHDNLDENEPTATAHELYSVGKNTLPFRREEYDDSVKDEIQEPS